MIGVSDIFKLVEIVKTKFVKSESDKVVEILKDQLNKCEARNLRLEKQLAKKTLRSRGKQE